jgi:hypothetical protein
MFDCRSFFVRHFLPPVLKKVVVEDLLRCVVVVQHFGIEPSHLNMELHKRLEIDLKTGESLADTIKVSVITVGILHS